MTFLICMLCIRFDLEAQGNPVADVERVLPHR